MSSAAQAEELKQCLGDKESCDDNAFKYASSTTAKYGKDISWPMHQDNIYNTRSNPFGGDRQKLYSRYLNGCYKYYSKELCKSFESFRLMSNRRQPVSVRNYTQLGFKKIRTPPHLYNLIKNFWNERKHLQREEPVRYGDALINLWDNHTSIVAIDAHYNISKSISDETAHILQEWTGISSLDVASCYGIRIYKSGSILSTHVDELPFLIAAVINVDQDVDEPWPFEMIGHDGMAYNITMTPGDMVLYESSSILHGRPFPLKGRFYSNVIAHFSTSDLTDAGIPSYIIKGSPEDVQRTLEGSYNELIEFDRTVFKRAHTYPAHVAVTRHQLDFLRELLDSKDHKETLYKPDENGWTPLHLAAKGCHVDMIEFLIENGSNLYALNNDQQTPLDIAISNSKSSCTNVKLFHTSLSLLTNLRYPSPQYAAYAGDLDFIKRLVSFDNKVIYQRDSNGWSMLHEAARNGHLNIVKYLIQTDQRLLNITTSQGKTAIHYARMFLSPQHDVVKYLGSFS